MPSYQSNDTETRRALSLRKYAVGNVSPLKGRRECDVMYTFSTPVLETTSHFDRILSSGRAVRRAFPFRCIESFRDRRLHATQPTHAGAGDPIKKGFQIAANCQVKLVAIKEEVDDGPRVWGIGFLRRPSSSSFRGRHSGFTRGRELSWARVCSFQLAGTPIARPASFQGNRNVSEFRSRFSLL